MSGWKAKVLLRRRLLHGLVTAVLTGSAAAPCARSQIQETAIEELAVHAEVLRRTTVHAYVTAYGTVEPAPATRGAPAAAVRVAAPFDGLVAEAPAVEGRVVRQGDVLFGLDSRQADAAVAQARADVEAAEQTLERQRLLISTDGTSQKALQEATRQIQTARALLQAAEVRRSLLDIRAPISGVVARVTARSGETVAAGAPLAEVLDPNRLVATVAVPGSEAADLRVGQPTTVETTEALSVTGTVIYVAPEADPGTDCVTVRVALLGHGGLIPGRFVRARIVSQTHENRLTAPVQALIKTPDRGAVVVVIERATAHRRPVTIGLIEDDRVEIAGEGLDDRTLIVTREAYGVPDGVAVRIITE